MGNLGTILLAAGAPLLKEIMEKGIGGMGGKLAGAVIERLGEQLGVPATPEAVGQAIEQDPGAAAIVRAVEEEAKTDFARIAEANRDMMVSYHRLLESDQNAEGWLQKRWRSLFAVAFTFSFVGIVFTVCRAIWISQLVGVEAVSGLLITLIFAGCAVLGVQVWRDDKRAG